MNEHNDPGIDAILRRWQTTHPEDRLAHLVKDAWRTFSRILQIHLMEHSVSYGHWTFLRILWEKDGLTQQELSAEAGVVAPTTYAAVKTMERLGYVKRKKSPDNRKKIYIYLTKKGRKLKDELIPLAVQINEIAVEGIDERDIAVTRNTLIRMIKNCANWEQQAAAKENRLPSTRELSKRLARKEKRVRSI